MKQDLVPAPIQRLSTLQSSLAKTVQSGQVTKIARALTDALEVAEQAEHVIFVERLLEETEELMREAGLYSTAKIRPINETRMRARWKLGAILGAVERAAGPGRGKKGVSQLTSFRDYIKKLGLTGDSASKAQRVATLPEKDLEDVIAEFKKSDRLLSYEILISRAQPYWRKTVQKRAVGRTKAIELNAVELGKFALLYGDPPWRYENPPMGSTSRSIENHYPTAPLEVLCALPVADIAHEDSILFLWATAPKLYESMQLLDAWGFTYRTCMVWVKDKIGMGYHARNRHELLLIAKKGELPPPQPEDRPESVFCAARGDHSVKPDMVYPMLERMYPDLRKIELFASGTGPDGERQAPPPRDGWTFWGNQIEGDEKT